MAPPAPCNSLSPSPLFNQHRLQVPARSNTCDSASPSNTAGRATVTSDSTSLSAHGSNTGGDERQRVADHRPPRDSSERQQVADHRRPGARSCNTGRRGVDAARGHSPPQDAGVSTPLVDTRPGVSIALRAPLLFTVMADARGCRA